MQRIQKAMRRNPSLRGSWNKKEHKFQTQTKILERSGNKKKEKPIKDALQIKPR